MCLAVPGLVVSLSRDGGSPTGEVEFAGARRRVDFTCLPTAAVGEYVLVHAGLAITKIDEAEALETLETLRQIEELARS